MLISSNAGKGDRMADERMLQAWLKGLGRLDDGPVYWWFTGITHGLTAEGGLMPLFRHENFSFGHYRRESDRRYTSVMQDVTLYRDLDSGELLSAFDNPYTGSTVSVDEIITKDINNFYDMDEGFGFIADGNRIPQPLDLEATEVDGLTWMTRVMDWQLPNPLDPERHKSAWTGPMVRLQMETTLRLDLAELADPAMHSVTATSGYEAISPWFPWLEMGGVDGHLVTRAVGKKLASYDLLPEKIAAVAEERFPGCISSAAEPPLSNDPWMGYLQRADAH